MTIAAILIFGALCIAFGGSMPFRVETDERRVV
jgi:hypothetical protein